MSEKSEVYIHKDKEKSILRKHPWVFSGAIYGISNELNDGEWVEVIDFKGNRLGTGYYSEKGSIAVRMLCFADEEWSNDFWLHKLQSAWNLRQKVINQDTTNCFRLIHGEGDGIPGLVIDYYDKNWIIQAHSVGIYNKIEEIANIISTYFKENCNTIYCKSAQSLPQIGTDYFLKGTTEECVAKENTIQFKVNWIEGQKTGFFLDQRDNRFLLQHYSKGAEVLNTFCYTGGFSLYALAAGAKQVTSVDISQKAIDLVNENVIINQLEENHTAVCSDVFKYMQEHSKKFDVIILDPPAFAKSLKVRHNAVQAYKRLNKAGIDAIKNKGIIFTFSCSQVVDEQLFYHTIAAAAIESGKKIRVLHKLTQGADHPVSIYHPEGSYLKGLVLQIEE